MLFRLEKVGLVAAVSSLLGMGLGAACSSRSEDFDSDDGQGASAGDAPTGATGGSGGVVGGGGAQSTGGKQGTGGRQGQGGVQGKGGLSGTAGEAGAAEGGSDATGGMAGEDNGGTSGSSGSGGAGTAGAAGGGKGGTGGSSGAGGAGGAGCACVRGTCRGTTCLCDLGFDGVRCDECEAGRYGPNCSACTCQNGTCADGISGTGACSCQLGWVGASCSLRPASCRALATAFPSAASNTYVIDPDGASGSIAPFSAYCDMTYDGGGWTLIMATNALGPAGQSPGIVAPLSGTHMPVATMLALAASGISSQIHVRSAGQPTVASITSTPNSTPMVNLRENRILNSNSGMYSGSAVVTEWTGPYATAYHLWHSCGPAPYGSVAGYPDIWWACNNGNGMHLANMNSGWNADIAQNQAMEVYVR